MTSPRPPYRILSIRATRLGLAATVCLAAMLPAGCGDGRPRRVPVSGRVLIDGQPVTQGTIAIIPEKARASGSDIGPDGRFTMTCFGDEDGVVPGTHTVTVTSIQDIDQKTRKQLVPPKYSEPETSDLKVTIDGPNDALTINLTWAGGKPFIERFVNGTWR
jgi:hypothetical protein